MASFRYKYNKKQNTDRKICIKIHPSKHLALSLPSKLPPLLETAVKRTDFGFEIQTHSRISSDPNSSCQSKRILEKSRPRAEKEFSKFSETKSWKCSRLKIRADVASRETTVGRNVTLCRNKTSLKTEAKNRLSFGKAHQK